MFNIGFGLAESASWATLKPSLLTCARIVWEKGTSAEKEALLKTLNEAIAAAPAKAAGVSRFVLSIVLSLPSYHPAHVIDESPYFLPEFVQKLEALFPKEKAKIQAVWASFGHISIEEGGPG